MLTSKTSESTKVVVVVIVEASRTHPHPQEMDDPVLITSPLFQRRVILCFQ